MSEKVTLSEAQIDMALVAYSRGKTSAHVLDELLFEFADLDDTPENRAMLRDQLRAVNPNDKRFSQSKYGLRFDSVYSVVIEELRLQSRTAMQDVISAINSGMSELDDIGEVLSSMLDNASDSDITSNTEFLNTVRTYASLQKIRIEGVNAIANLVDQLCKLHAIQTGTRGEDSE